MQVKIVLLASENSENECKLKFRKCMLASENSENVMLLYEVKIQKMNAFVLQVKIQKINACKWKFSKLMLASENSEN